MLQSPVDIAIVAGVILLIFGPQDRPKSPWRWKPETWERNKNSPVDPFPMKRADLYITRGEKKRLD